MFHSAISKQIYMRRFGIYTFKKLYKVPIKAFSVLSPNDFVVNLKSESDFEKEVTKCHLPVLIDFYADWCAPCRKSGPILESKANDLRTFKLVKVNVDHHPELSEKFQVGGVPYFVLMKDGKKVGDLVGFNESKLDSMLTAI